MGRARFHRRPGVLRSSTRRCRRGRRRTTTDVLVTTGSPVTPFSQNKQNEPAVAIDAHAPSVVVAGLQRRDRRRVLRGR